MLCNNLPSGPVYRILILVCAVCSLPNGPFVAHLLKLFTMPCASQMLRPDRGAAQGGAPQQGRRAS